MAGGTGRSGDSSEVYNGRKNLYRYGRPDNQKSSLANSEKERMSVTYPGESGRGERDVRAVCERRKGCTASEFFFGLSGTANSMRMAAEELSEEYPERKILQWIRFAPAWEKDFFYIKRCS